MIDMINISEDKKLEVENLTFQELVRIHNDRVFEVLFRHFPDDPQKGIHLCKLGCMAIDAGKESWNCTEHEEDMTVREAATEEAEGFMLKEAELISELPKKLQDRMRPFIEDCISTGLMWEAGVLMGDNRLNSLSSENREIAIGIIELCGKVQDGTINHVDKKRYQVIKVLKHANNSTLDIAVSQIAYDRTEAALLESKGPECLKDESPEMMREAERLFQEYVHS